MTTAKRVLLLVCLATWCLVGVAGLVLAEPFEAYLDRGAKVLVWKDQAAMDKGLALVDEDPASAEVVSLVACIVPSGTKARLDRIGASPAWKAMILEGEFKGCQGVVGGRDFKTAGEREKPPPRAVGAPPPKPALQPPPVSDADREAAAQAISALKALRWAIEPGLSYDEYGARLADTRAVVEAAREHLSNQPLSDAIEAAMTYYRGAAIAWRFNKGGAQNLTGQTLSTYQGCKYIDELLAEERDPGKAGGRAVGRLLACAADALANAELLATAPRQGP